jgi:hypothetical protein
MGALTLYRPKRLRESSLMRIPAADCIRRRAMNSPTSQEARRTDVPPRGSRTGEAEVMYW